MLRNARSRSTRSSSCNTFVAEAFGFLPSAPWRWGGVTPFTSFFIHGGFVHLLGNAYFLFAFGPQVEQLLGLSRYLLVLIGAAILGAAAHMLIDPRAHIVLIGASGGISVLIAFYVLAFPGARMKLFFLSLRFGIARWLSLSVRTWL